MSWKIGDDDHIGWNSSMRPVKGMTIADSKVNKPTERHFLAQPAESVFVAFKFKMIDGRRVPVPIGWHDDEEIVKAFADKIKGDGFVSVLPIPKILEVGPNDAQDSET